MRIRSAVEDFFRKVQSTENAEESDPLTQLQERNKELEDVCQLALKDITRLSTVVLEELDTTKRALAEKSAKMSELEKQLADLQRAHADLQEQAAKKE